jgi:hypothetical protein
MINDKFLLGLTEHLYEGLGYNGRININYE